MCREAAEQIKGLSLGARTTLGVAALLLAVMVLAIEPPAESSLFVHAFAGFNLAITVACVTHGRIRQFAGSIIGVGLFALSSLYLASQLGEGKILSGSRSVPSVLNAVIFMLFFGFPGITYAFKARFGFRKPRRCRQLGLP